MDAAALAVGLGSTLAVAPLLPLAGAALGRQLVAHLARAPGSSAWRGNVLMGHIAEPVRVSQWQLVAAPKPNPWQVRDSGVPLCRHQLLQRPGTLLQRPGAQLFTHSAPVATRNGVTAGVSSTGLIPQLRQFLPFRIPLASHAGPWAGTGLHGIHGISSISQRALSTGPVGCTISRFSATLGRSQRLLSSVATASPTAMAGLSPGLRAAWDRLSTAVANRYPSVHLWAPLLPVSWWSTWEALYHSSVKWLPSMPGIRAAYLDVLSALNLAGGGAGGALLRTLAFTAVEAARETAHVRAQGFDMALPAHLALVDNTSGPRSPWILATLWIVGDTLVNICRALWLAIIFTPVILSSPLALHLNLYRAEWLELLRRTLEAGGPAFIKWGQWAATRHDLFPPDLCAELEQLHSQAPAHKFKHTQKAIQAAFGMRVAELFDWIEHSPVASGSIGQIHRARLSARGAALTGFEPGQLVAVKVRHPGVADTILRDFSTMMGIAHLLALLPAMRHLRLEDTLKQFAAPLKEQVDLAREASNLQRFNFNFRNTPAVLFPVPLYPLVSSEVLVETYEEGDHISRYINGDDTPVNHRLSLIGSGTMLQMMLMDNLIHSDLHPGNILVRLTPPNGLLGLIYNALDTVKRSDLVSNRTRARLDVLQQRWLQPQMVLLDVGMATELTDEDQKNMVGLFRSFAAMDGEACGQWTLAFSGEQQECPDPVAFKKAMAATFDELRRLDEGATWGETQFRNSADTLAHVLELVRQYHVTLPGHICAVVVTTLVLEGWSNKLDPDHSVLTQVQKMFEGVNVPWRTRLPHTVDTLMTEDPDQLVNLA